MNEKKSKKTSSKQFWTTENASRLIECYEMHPCLYNVRSKDYHNRNLKNKAYSDICQSLNELFPDKNFTPALVKAKIHTIRTLFMAEINKIKKSEASGASPDEIYQPVLWCFQNLLFLEGTFEVVSEGESNMPEESHSSQATENLEETELLLDATIEEVSSAPFSLDEEELSCSSEHPSTSKDDQREDTTSAFQSQRPRSADTPKSTKSDISAAKKRKHEELQLATILEQTSKAISDMSTSMTTEPPVDPFANYLSSEMKKIEDEEILDAFKENVLQELYQAKKAFREKMKRKSRTE